MPTRRNFLAVTGTLAVAGCSASGDSTPTPEPTDAEQKVLTKRVRSTTLPNPGYAALEFTPETDDKVVISYEVGVDGSDRVDVLGFEGSELDKYKEDDSKADNFASYHPGLSSFGVNYEQNGYPVPPTRYGIVIDNTDYGTDATTEVAVSFTIRVSRA